VASSAGIQRRNTDAGKHRSRREPITLDSGATVPYDTLVIAAVPCPPASGTGVDEHASPEVARRRHRIRRRILDQFERAAADPSSSMTALNVVVWAAGRQHRMAGDHELFNKVLRHDFPDLPVRWARGCWSKQPIGCSTTSEQSSRRMRTLAPARVHVGVGVNRSSPRVHLAGGTVVPAHAVIWAAGVA
jgi:hypothetical protein